MASAKTFQRGPRRLNAWHHKAFTVGKTSFPAYGRTDIHNPDLADLKIGDYIVFTFYGNPDQHGNVEGIEGGKILTTLYKGGTQQRALKLDISRLNISWTPAAEKGNS